jgi:hypothetical protein
MAVRFTAGKGRAAGKTPMTFGVPWSERGSNTASFNRGPAVGGAAKPPAPAGLPVDPFYDAAVGGANRNFAAELAQAQYQRGQLGQAYGLGVDPTGNVFEDVSNPYSRAATLQQLYDQSKRGSSTSMAAQGQLYSGAFQNAQNDLAQSHGRSRDAMIREFMAARDALTGRELGAGNARQDALAQAGSDAVMRAVANRPDPLSVPAVAAPVLPRAPAPVKPRKPTKPRGRR